MAQAEMDMTPMIDVTFQLIAFFMFVLNFSEVDQDQRINLPSSELARPPDVAYDEPLTIQLTERRTDHLRRRLPVARRAESGAAARSADHQDASREKSRGRDRHHPRRPIRQDGQSAGNHQALPGSRVRHVRPPRQAKRPLDVGGAVINHRDTEALRMIRMNQIVRCHSDLHASLTLCLCTP